jgi:ABC-type transporter Mla subunit MlaD
MATAAKTALDEHVAQSSKLIEQGATDKAAILKRQDEQDHTIATLADAVKIAAQSTPPHEETT